MTIPDTFTDRLHAAESRLDRRPQASARTEQVRGRVLAAKHAYSTRSVADHVRAAAELDLVESDYRPRLGDVVLARVVEIGQHKRLESPVSRRQILFPGDEVLLAYGSRYAADQFLAEIPEDLGPCHLAAAGGLASRVVDQHAAVDEATLLEPVGVLRDGEGVVSLQRTAAYSVAEGVADHPHRPAHDVTVIGVLGTSMNSGKSTVLAHLAHGLAAAGLTVAAGKATGTGAGNDSGLFGDAGAHRVLDFTDFGIPSTYRLPYECVRDVFAALTDELAVGHPRPDVVLVEIADGLFQGETARLITDPVYTRTVDMTVFAAGEALGAAGGTQVLTSLGQRPGLVSGVLTASPIATVEACREVDAPVVPTFDLSDPAVASQIIARVREDALAG